MATGDDESAWTEVQLPAPAMREAAESRRVKPVRTYVTEFNTNDDTQLAAFLAYLLNPIPVLTGQLTEKQQADGAVAGLLSRLVVDGVHDGWKVVTVLRNHHRGLNPRINFATATVSEEEETLYQDVYKQLD